MRLQKRKGTVDGYEWRCRNQSKDNRHDVVRSWYWARTRDKASNDPIPIPLGYRGHKKIQDGGCQAYTIPLPIFVLESTKSCAKEIAVDLYQVILVRDGLS
ncbi:hypothetical protein TNCV_780891 [Trichonephila clavipes]|nr:hypothetical protein TNCV_780891 [Trichonephila clavipes]